MEHKVRKAFVVANELASQSPQGEYGPVFNAVFHSMLAGTFACPVDCDESAISELSRNLGKWLGAITEAILANNTNADQTQVNVLRDRLKASNDAEEAAVKAATDQPSSTGE